MAHRQEIQGNTGAGDHLASIIESQYEELSLAKKQLLEYDAREAAIQQRWNLMLQVYLFKKENLKKDDKIRGLKLQIERNLDNIQLLMVDHDSRMFDLSKKVFEVMAICGKNQQKDAALYLTEQLPQVQEERRELILENEQYHLSNQETINDIERAKNALDRFKVYIDNNIDLDRASQNQVLAHFKEKLDKAHDKVELEKADEKVSVLSELRATLEHQELATAIELLKKQSLQNKYSE